MDKNDAISNLACLSSLNNGLNGLLNIMLTQHDVNLNTRQHINRIRARASTQRDTPLTTMTIYLNHIHPDDANFMQRLSDIIEFFFPNNCLDFLKHLLFILY